MTVIATDIPRFSSLVKLSDSANNLTLFTESGHLDFAGSTNPVKFGTVVGQATGSATYVVSKFGATDGSQVPVGVYISDQFGHAKDLPAQTDPTLKLELFLVRGKIELAQTAIVWDATWGAAGGANITSGEQALIARGLLVSPTV